MQVLNLEGLNKVNSFLLTHAQLECIETRFQYFKILNYETPHHLRMEQRFT